MVILERELTATAHCAINAIELFRWSAHYIRNLSLQIMNRIAWIERETVALRKQLVEHRLYSTMKDVNHVRLFMESHVFAVWDFMSLLKTLQQGLTCVQVPWRPAINSITARLINEIVLGEESDIDLDGKAISHFEMYLEAMTEVGADASRLKQLLAAATDMRSIPTALAQTPLSKAESDFLSFTFATIASGELHKVAAAFTFGREGVIPEMFLRIVAGANGKGAHLYPRLTYYLKRHIEVDGDEHGPMSMEMINELCGTDEKRWAEVLEVACTALKHRIALWDEVAEKIEPTG